MSFMTEASFKDRMDKLTIAQESILNTSSWIQLGRSNARELATWWEAYFSRADQDKRLSMIYLANDVLQNSRKKGPEFIAEFFKVLPRALRHYLSKSQGKAKERVERVIGVWEERRVFGSNSAKFRQLVDQAELPVSPPAAGNGSSQHPFMHSAPGTAAPPATASLPLLPSGFAPPAAFQGVMEAMARADAATRHSGQLADSVAVTRPSALSPLASPEQKAAVVSLLRGYIAALEAEISARQAARRALSSALDELTACESKASMALRRCAAELAALEGRPVDPIQDSTPQPAAAGMGPQTLPSAPVLAGEAEGANVSSADIAAAEAAALAAQLVADPSAMSLFKEALSAAGGTSLGHEDEEYDPENAFG
jgi:regulator of Ty1 transposition protein 103